MGGASGKRRTATREDSSPMAVRRAVLDHVRAGSKNTSASNFQILRGKVGIITGVGPPMGIGTATAWLMIRHGAAHLYLLDYSPDHLETLSTEIHKSFPQTQITFARGDAADSKVVSALVDQVMKEEQHLDFFFANAGILHRPLPAAQKDDLATAVRKSIPQLDRLDDDEIMEVFRVNVLGVLLAIKYAAPAMSKLCPERGKTIPGGSIILTASVAGKAANAGPIPYSASKAAVISLAQTCAAALTGQNVRVNAICPGLIETDMPRAIFMAAEARGKGGEVGKLNPLLRQGLPSEVAHVASFLASDNASYINGQAIAVDGGLTASLPFIAPRL